MKSLPSIVSSFDKSLAVEQEWRRRQALKRVVLRDPLALMRGQGLEPDPWQERVLKSNARRLLLLCCRQSGKSTTTGALAVNTILDTPGALVVLTSPSLDQSQELFRKVIDCYRSAVDPVRMIRSTTTEAEYANGARIVCKSSNADTIRGFSAVHTVIVDEAAMAEDALFTAISPMLAVSGGRLILLSTPKGQRGFFHNQWDNGGPLWTRITATAKDCPRITQEFLDSELATMGSTMFEQEYMCRFVQSLDQYFRTEDIHRAFQSTEPGLFDGAILA